MRIDNDEVRAMRDTVRQGRGRGLSARLLKAVMALGGGQAELISQAERPWASATFTGSRHSVRLAFHGTEGVAAAEQFIEALPEHEFALPGQLVADAAITEVRLDMLPQPRFELEAELLLLDDA